MRKVTHPKYIGKGSRKASERDSFINLLVLGLSFGLMFVIFWALAQSTAGFELSWLTAALYVFAAVSLNAGVGGFIEVFKTKDNLSQVWHFIMAVIDILITIYLIYYTFFA